MRTWRSSYSLVANEEFLATVENREDQAWSTARNSSFRPRATLRYVSIVTVFGVACVIFLAFRTSISRSNQQLDATIPGMVNLDAATPTLMTETGFIKFEVNASTPQVRAAVQDSLMNTLNLDRASIVVHILKVHTNHMHIVNPKHRVVAGLKRKLSADPCQPVALPVTQPPTPPPGNPCQPVTGTQTTSPPNPGTVGRLPTSQSDIWEVRFMLCSIRLSQAMNQVTHHDMMRFAEELAISLWRVGVKYAMVQQTLVMISMKILGIERGVHEYCEEWHPTTTAEPETTTEPETTALYNVSYNGTYNGTR
eukprot:CAMPEP_0169328374 /NCGR_PEP_ID=MMETSP1017-20121227/12543_1 /TAXON_ID=342587 /ORGANISM="Karlodinium micrum, Strain CCMP2283" /LENGTH=308 /DNA_ID=CAMNT_0009423227 /DNA_START=97 /DNA_END=1023 /DNA_ORIENTATION=+